MIWRVGVLAGVFFASSIALADTPPTRWDRARNPALEVEQQLHQEIRQRIIAGAPERDDLPLANATGEARLGEMRAALEAQRAEKSPFPLVRLDLAFIYTQSRLPGGPRWDKAAEIYKSTLAEFPDHPANEQSWLHLAFACGHMGDHICEQKSYLKVLELQTEEAYRMTPILNLAETQMHLGDLKEAIVGYREAIRLSSRVPVARETTPLATWGLAVALDRSGDRIEAEKQARFAMAIEHSMGLHGPLLHSNGVFFVPDYEVLWYDGLGAMATARTATSPQESLTLWRAAERLFKLYIDKAEAARGEPDRWLPLAKERLALVRKERERAEKAPMPKPKPLPPVLNGDFTF